MAGKSLALIQRVVAVGVLCVSSAAGAAAPPPAQHPRREVLPDGAVPVHYDLALAPDAETLTFRGKLAITIHVGSANPSITLNAVGLTFDHTTLDGGPDAQVTLDKTLGRATMNFGKAIATGQHVVTSARWPTSVEINESLTAYCRTSIAGLPLFGRGPQTQRISDHGDG